MHFISTELDNYCGDHTSPETDLLAALNRDTHIKIINPRMLSGHLQGQFLKQLSLMKRPTNILEIGTYTGYSALCLAAGLSPEGELHTVDINEELEVLVDEYFSKSEQRAQLHHHIGNALDIVPTLKKDWDLVFIDADKSNYINYYNLLIDDLKPGAVILVDNVLWSGKVLEPTEANDEDTHIIKNFNILVTEDERVENILLPIRDGLMMITKK